MLLTFEIENFLSFKERQAFTFLADYNRANIFNKNTIAKIPKDRDSSKKSHVLNGSLLYGANAGGKTNFISAFHTLRQIVENEEALQQIHGEPVFKFTDHLKPSSFKITILKELNHKPFLLHYELTFSENEITYEKLSRQAVKHTTLGKENIIYERNYQEIKQYNAAIQSLIDEFLPTNFRNNTLLHLFVNKINHSYFKNIVRSDAFQWMHAIYHFITENIVLKNHDDLSKNDLADRINKDSNLKQAILHALDDVDITIDDFEIIDITNAYMHELIHDMRGLSEQTRNSMVHEQIQQKRIYDIKTIRKTNHNRYALEFMNESRGTIEFIRDFIQIFDCIQNNKVYIVDEIENHYHPMIQRYILKTFLDADDENNKSRAQFIFTTHNTDFLEANLLAKEQIWFVDKSSQTLASELYRFSEFQDISYKNHNWRNLYNEGRFGAFPKVMD
ncbi:ATP-binding protein [Oceanobacillus sp. FSL W7-1293]|uniref:AAA family ATPase n=1 Tax=Oceanobacillus sp. FSL W7-1293 TaxID=2921699 RepID=UPI0030CBA02D